MKSVLGCLMCFVLTLSQSFALSGGPFGGGVNVVGTYAGVLKRPSDSIPMNLPCDQLQPPIVPVPDCSANSLGVFSVGVPSTGTSSGTFVMFSQGRVFTGTIQGTADPGTAKLTGVLNATFQFTVTLVDKNTDPPSTTTINVTASANGNLQTKIRIVRSGAAILGAVRLSGTATLNTDQGEVNPDTNQPCITCYTTLRVVGFKQSNTAPTSSTSG